MLASHSSSWQHLTAPLTAPPTSFSFLSSPSSQSLFLPRVFAFLPLQFCPSLFLSPIQLSLSFFPVDFARFRSKQVSFVSFCLVFVLLEWTFVLLLLFLLTHYFPPFISTLCLGYCCRKTASELVPRCGIGDIPVAQVQTKPFCVAQISRLLKRGTACYLGQ